MLEGISEALQFLGGHPGRHGGAQSADHEQRPDVFQCIRAPVLDENRDHGAPEIGAGGKVEPFWHHPDDRVIAIVKMQRSSYGSGIGTESGHPHPVAQYGDAGDPRLVVLGAEVSTKHRENAHGLKEGNRDSRGRQSRRLSGFIQYRPATWRSRPLRCA